MGEEKWEKSFTYLHRGATWAYASLNTKNGTSIEITMPEECIDQIISDHNAAARLHEAETALRDGCEGCVAGLPVLGGNLADMLGRIFYYHHESDLIGDTPCRLTPAARAYFSQPIEEGQQR